MKKEITKVTIGVNNSQLKDISAEDFAIIGAELDEITEGKNFRCDAEQGICATVETTSQVNAIVKLFDEFGLSYHRYIATETEEIIDTTDAADNNVATVTGIKVETKIAKNLSARYYIRKENGKLKQISREMAIEIVANNGTLAERREYAELYLTIAKKPVSLETLLKKFHMTEEEYLGAARIASNLIAKRLRAELEDDPYSDDDDFTMARYITSVAFTPEGQHGELPWHCVAIRSTDFARAEKALNIIKTSLIGHAIELVEEPHIVLAPVLMNGGGDHIPVYYAAELDGSEDDDSEEFAFDLLPSVDELNDIEDTEDEEDIAAIEAELAEKGIVVTSRGVFATEAYIEARKAYEHIQNVYSGLLDFIDIMNDLHGLTQEQCGQIYVALFADRNYCDPLNVKLRDKMIAEFEAYNKAHGIIPPPTRKAIINAAREREELAARIKRNLENKMRESICLTCATNIVDTYSDNLIAGNENRPNNHRFKRRRARRLAKNISPLPALKKKYLQYYEQYT